MAVLDAGEQEFVADLLGACYVRDHEIKPSSHDGLLVGSQRDLVTLA
jgi:hypothetical protein